MGQDPVKQTGGRGSMHRLLLQVSCLTTLFWFLRDRFLALPGRVLRQLTLGQAGARGANVHERHARVA